MIKNSLNDKNIIEEMSDSTPRAKAMRLKINS